MWWQRLCNPLSGFSGNLDTRGLSNGIHTLQVVARGSGDLPSVFERQILVNNTCTPPGVSISASSFSVTGSVEITADTSDTTGVTDVSFYVDGAYLATATSAPFAYRWDTTSWPGGSHVITATAHNGCGNKASATRVFTVVKDVD